MLYLYKMSSNIKESNYQVLLCISPTMSFLMNIGAFTRHTYYEHKAFFNYQKRM